MVLLHEKTAKTLQSYFTKKDKLISALMLGDPNTISTVLSIKGVISTEEKVQIFLASTQSEKNNTSHNYYRVSNEKVLKGFSKYHPES